MDKIRELRAKDFSGGPSLVVTISGEEQDFPLGEQIKEFPEFIVTLCDSPSEKIRQASESLVTAALTAFTLAAVNPLSIKKVHSEIVLRNANKKIVYAFRMSGKATVFASIAISHEIIEATKTMYFKLAKTQVFDRVYRLLVASMQNETDKFRSFLTAWTALEIFLNKTFKEHEILMFDELNKGDHPTTRRQYLNRIQDVMKDKYNIYDRFSLISYMLCPGDADADIEIFRSAKKMRDDLSHGQDVTESLLPVVEVRNLTRKYLRIYLKS
jgi:hypothetical protein